MLIKKYLENIILKTFLLVFTIVLLIFISQSMIQGVNQIVKGNIHPNFLLTYVIYTLPSLVNWYLPISIFLSILITCTRLYRNNELTAITACGGSNNIIVKASARLTIFTVLVTIITSFWLSPYLLEKRNKTITQNLERPELLLFNEGKFVNVPNTGYVVFIKKIDRNKLNDIYIFDRQQDQNKVIYAESGVISYKDGNRYITLSNGYLYNELNNNNSHVKYYNNSFKQMSLLLGSFNINNNSSRAEQNINSLINNVRENNDTRSLMEIIYRVSIALMIIILSYLAIAFGRLPPRVSNMNNIISGISFFFIFLISLNSIFSLSISSNTNMLLEIIILFIFFTIITMILFIQNKFTNKNKVVTFIRKMLSIN